MLSECIVAGTAAAAAAFTVNVARTRREEIVGREFDLAENVARRICRIVALLFRNTEIVYRHKHLYIAYKLYDRKQTESREYGPSVCAKRRVYRSADSCCNT